MADTDAMPVSVSPRFPVRHFVSAQEDGGIVLVSGVRITRSHIGLRLTTRTRRENNPLLRARRYQRPSGRRSQACDGRKSPAGKRGGCTYLVRAAIVCLEKRPPTDDLVTERADVVRMHVVIHIQDEQVHVTLSEPRLTIARKMIHPGAPRAAPGQKRVRRKHAEHICRWCIQRTRRSCAVERRAYYAGSYCAGSCRAACGIQTCRLRGRQGSGRGGRVVSPSGSSGGPRAPPLVTSLRPRKATAETTAKATAETAKLSPDQPVPRGAREASPACAREASDPWAACAARSCCCDDRTSPGQ